jgi:5-methylcytosine-specific restriction endonuclease McrBC regulatory subunit McrC
MVNSLQQVHIITDASTVYNKYTYLLMREHSLQQLHILTDVSAVYNKYIYLLMRQQSTTSTYTC